MIPFHPWEQHTSFHPCAMLVVLRASPSSHGWRDNLCVTVGPLLAVVRSCPECLIIICVPKIKMLLWFHVWFYECIFNIHMDVDVPLALGNLNLIRSVPICLNDGGPIPDLRT